MTEAGATVLVLGLGNDLLTDDAVGLHVARAVRTRLEDEPVIVVRETMEMGLALLDEIVGFDHLVLVDSIQTGQVPPGQVQEFGIESLAGRRSGALHFVGVAETLALGKALGLPMPRQVRIFAIEVEDPFRLGTEMTPALTQAVAVAADRVAARARAFAGSPAETPVACGPAFAVDPA